MKQKTSGSLCCACLLAYLLFCSQATARRDLRGIGRQLLDTCNQPSYGALTPAITRAPVLDLDWLDPADQKILALTKKTGMDQGGLWLSEDGGKTWTEQTGQLNSTAPATEQIEVIRVFSKKSKPNNVFILGAGTWYWTSSDYGKTVTARQTPTKWRGMSIKAIKQHPTQEDWLLLLVKRPDCKALDRAQMECPHDLIYTGDLFSGNPTWVNLTEKAGGRIAGFVDFDWARNLCFNNDCGSLPPPKDELIFATMYAKPGDYDQPWDPDVHFVSSDNWFSKFTTQVRCGNMFEIVGRSVYLALANSCPTDINGNQKHDTTGFPQGITLYTSQDGGKSFNQACLPVAIKQEGYELLETHDGSGAIIIVDFLINNGLPASSVYTAGPHHALFSLSLTDVFHAENSFGYSFGSDFARIEGLPGVYIANQMLPRPDTSSYDYYDSSDIVGTPLVETRITYNGGARWQRIPAPASYNFPVCNRCEGQAECYLHLHGISSWDSMLTSMPSVYSSVSAPGVIMASGNTGVKGVGLDDSNGVCTWLSTDGGVTWHDVAIGTYIYEYADWGSTIVMGVYPGAAAKAADEVLFSTDGGQCWNRVPLKEALLLENIRIEPDGQRPRVVLHGRRCRKDTNPLCAYPAGDSSVSNIEGIMYTLDVQELLGTKVGLCTAADRELWGIPSDLGGQQTRCVLGRQTLIQRRRLDAKCFNGPDYQRPSPTYTPCNCTVESDLECDYGYIRIGSECQALPSERMPTCPVVENSKYTVSSTGKRLVHADTCEHIESVLPDTNGKGQSTGGGGGGGSSSGGGKKRSGWVGFLIFLLVLVVLGAAFVGWWIYLATESQRDMIRDVVAGAADTVHTVKVWILEKISRRRHPGVVEQDLGYFQPLGNSEDSSEATPLFTLK